MARGKRVEIVKIIVDGTEVDAKACTKCGEVKVLACFNKRATSSNGRQSYCRECQNGIDRERLEKRAVESGRLVKKRPRWSNRSYREWVLSKTKGEYNVLGDYINNKTKIPHLHVYCGTVWDTRPNDFRSGYMCPYCASSKGEQRVVSFLLKIKVAFKTNYRVSGCRDRLPLPFDVAVIGADGVKLFIEYDGIQHFEPQDFAGKGEGWAREQFRETRRRDRIKTNYCLANGIPLIRIKHTEFDRIEEILTHRLAELGVTGKRLNGSNAQDSSKTSANNGQSTAKEDAA